MKRKPINTYRTRGFLLVPVVLFLSVMSMVAFLITMEGSFKADSADRAISMSKSAYAAEAAIAEATWRLNQNATCTSYTNLTDTTFGEHTYSATVGPTDGSPVVIQASASTASGTAAVASRTAKIYGPELSLVLQLGPSGKDSLIGGGAWFNYWFGDYDELWTSGDSANPARSLLEFDLSSLPANVQITSALLELELYSLGSYETVTAHRLIKSWIEDALTWRWRNWDYWWDTYGGDFDPHVFDSFVTDSTGIKALNLTALVEQWVNQGVSNYGVLLQSPTSGSASVNKYHSGDKSGEFTPRLTINYVCECGSPCATTALADTLLVSTMITTDVGGNSFDPEDLFVYEPDDDLSSLFTTVPLSASGDVDAVHQLNDGNIVMSTRGPEIFGGISTRPGDLLKFNRISNTATMYLNSIVFDAPVNVDAVHVLDDGNILLSTDTDAKLGGLSFTPDDVVEYDPGADTATLYFDGSAFASSENIDAFRVLASGNYLLSTSGSAFLGGLSFSQTDVVEYDPVDDSASLYVDDNVFSNLANVNALDRSDISAILPPDPPPPAMCDATVLDGFLRRTYDGSDGNTPWSSDWIEAGVEADGPTAGDFQVVADLNNYRAWLSNKNRRISRSADLSGYSTATLSFNYRPQGFDGTIDKVFVQVSADGSSWHELGAITVPNHGTYQSISYDISAWISATTHIQFSTSAGLNRFDMLLVDNVLICANL